MITIHDIVKRRGSRTVLDRVSFRAEPGRVTAFLGPNPDRSRVGGVIGV